MLHAAHDFKKDPLHSLHKLLFWRNEVEEDLTALVMVRPAKG